MSVACRFRLSLKTLLVLATLFCLFVGWRATAYIRHRHAIDALLAGGIELSYPHAVEQPSSLVDRLRKAIGPHPWLMTPNQIRIDDADVNHETLANLEELHGIEHVSVGSPHGDAEILSLLGSRSELRSVVLEGEQTPTKADSDGLSALSEASQLQMLALVNVPLPSTGLAFLSGCPQLEELAVAGIPVDDGHLSTIANCYQLKHLAFPGAEVSGHGLQQLESLPRLAYLDLRDANVSGSGYEAIGRLHPLEVLGLAGSNVADENLVHFYDLHHLRVLDLSRTAITDEGLKYLKVLTSLESLKLGETNLSDAAIDQLDAALPDWQREK